MNAANVFCPEKILSFRLAGTDKQEDTIKKSCGQSQKVASWFFTTFSNNLYL